MEIIVNGGPQNDHGTEEFMASLVSLPAIVPLLQSFLVERSVPCQSMMDFSKKNDEFQRKYIGNHRI